MTFWQLVWRSLAQHWRMHAAVALGAALGTAVLTGALVVGDSVRGSLRQLALERLGPIEHAVIADGFFRDALPRELAATNGFGGLYQDAHGAIVLSATVVDPVSQRRASQVALLAAGPDFFARWSDAPAALIDADSITINETVAAALDVREGSEVLVRLPLALPIPADSPLGRKTDLTQTQRLRVGKVISDRGIGRFGLRPNQQSPLVALADLRRIQRALDQAGKVNVLLVTGARQTLPADEALARLKGLYRPRLADFGLAITPSKKGYVSLTSTGMMLPAPVLPRAVEAFAGYQPQPVLTYLANDIRAGADDRGRIPYSTIAALDPRPNTPLGPLVTQDGEVIDRLADDEILLNDWVLQDLAAQGVTLQPGDPVRVTYFEPESTHGQVTEHAHEFRLRGVVPLSGAAADRDLTPELAGVTDEESIAYWDPPFPYDASRVRSTPPHDQDERYWDEYRATPKGFVSYETGRRLWGSRFGEATSLRFVPPAGSDVMQLASELTIDPATMGLGLRPVRAEALAASTGTTSFDQLFLGFSFFIIVASMMLVSLLFRLQAELRASELGVLLAVGWSPGRVRRLMLTEGAFVAAIGAAVGVLVGLEYARLMVWGLTTWWSAAVSTSLIALRPSASSLVIGLCAGIGVALLSILLAAWRQGRQNVCALLAGESGNARVGGGGRARWWIAIGLAVAAIVASGSSTLVSNDSRPIVFFCAGALALAGGIAAVHAMLVGRTERGLSPALSLLALAGRNSARHPGRSTLTIGLVASATFLIVAISAFRLEAPDTQERSSGTGGFAIFATSSQAIYHDLGTPDGRRDLGLTGSDDAALKDAAIYGLRVKPGDDASCLNLYQSTNPRVLGLPAALRQRGGFAWSATSALAPEDVSNPWRLLDSRPGRQQHQGHLGSREHPIPVILDANTATYSLHLGGVGDVLQIDNGEGAKVSLQVVGLLKDSIFQGDLLISEEDFVQAFPRQSGYQIVLVECLPAATEKLSDTLEKALGEQGLDCQPTRNRLEGFMRVQNTYLSTFQTLGGLGLLLGMVGLAVVQLRNVIERRRELAVLRAVGFSSRRLAAMVLFENCILVAGGLGIGVAAAAIAVWPHLVGHTSGLPWLSLEVILGIVFLVGLAAGLAAVRAAVRSPVLEVLRGE